MAQPVSCRLLTAETWFRSQISRQETCGEQSGAATVFPSQYHPKKAPLTPTLRSFATGGVVTNPTLPVITAVEALHKKPDGPTVSLT
jgi:hypothetical protein